jgi:hypothetical protein
MTGSGGSSAGSGGQTGSDPACAIVHCPPSDPSCCSGWFSFATVADVSRPAILGGPFTDTASSVSQTYAFDGPGEIGAIGVNLNTAISISMLKISASTSSSLVTPIFASLESADGSSRCNYAVTSDGQVDTQTPTGGTCIAPLGQGQRIDVRVMSNRAGSATLTITELDITSP